MIVKIIKKDNSTSLKLAKVRLERRIMGVYRIIAEFPSTDDLEIGDCIEVSYKGRVERFQIVRIQDRQVEADHITFKLANILCLDKYLNEPPTYSDNISFANISLDSIVAFLAPQCADHQIVLQSQATASELLDIQFTSVSLLRAIQLVADTWGVEFDISGDTITFKDRIVNETEYRAVPGLSVEAIQKEVDTSNLATRVYPLGSSENLPSNYFYDRLRPTTFNIETGVHIGPLYVEDSDAIAKWGLIEKVVDFDVKVQSFSGTIDSTGSEEYGNYGVVPFIVDSEIEDLDENRVLASSLYITSGLKSAVLPILGKSGSKIYYSPRLEDGSTLSWSPSAGDKYILVGYISSDEINSASQRLRDAALIFLEQHKEPLITYRLVNFLEPVQIGDLVKIGNESRRVIGFTYDFDRNICPTVELSDRAERIDSAFLREQIRINMAVRKLLREDTIKPIQRPQTYPEPEQEVELPGDLIDLPAPTSLNLSYAIDEIGVYIIAEWSPVEGAAGYRIRYSYDDLTYTELTTVTATRVEFYVMPASVVYVEVCAVSQYGTTSAWIRGSIQVGGEYTPPAPTLKGATGIFTSVQLEIDFPRNLLHLVNCFEVQVDVYDSFPNPISMNVQGLYPSVDVPQLLTTNERTVYVRVRSISYTGTPSAWSNIVQTQIFKIKGEYIAEATIDSAHIKNAAITTAHIKDASITSAKIAELDASKITTGYLDGQRIKAGSITADKLVSNILQGLTLVAGDPSTSHWRIDGAGIYRVIKSANYTWEKEIGSILYITTVRVPPTGQLDYTLPTPLSQDTVSIALIPASYPVSRAGVDMSSTSYSFKLFYEWINPNKSRIYARLVRETEPYVFIPIDTTVPVGSWLYFWTAPQGQYTESVWIKFMESTFPGFFTQTLFHAYTTPGRYQVGITRTTWPFQVRVAWGDGTQTWINMGLPHTLWIKVSADYAYNYSTSPVIYPVPADVTIIVFDRR